MHALYAVNYDVGSCNVSRSAVKSRGEISANFTVHGVSEWSSCKRTELMI